MKAVGKFMKRACTDAVRVLKVVPRGQAYNLDPQTHNDEWVDRARK